MKRSHVVFLVLAGLVCGITIFSVLMAGRTSPGPFTHVLARMGSADAQNRLGAACLSGPDKDPACAAGWFRKAADRGHAKAQYNLGVLHYQGQGVPRDRAIAAQWFRKAADQDFMDAQYNLGVMLYRGEGLPQDRREAFALYAKAAGRGHMNSQYNLGTMYLEGQGAPRDLVQAYLWLSLSAEQGFTDAVLNRDYAGRKMIPRQMEEARAKIRAWKAVH